MGNVYNIFCMLQKISYICTSHLRFSLTIILGYLVLGSLLYFSIWGPRMPSNMPFRPMQCRGNVLFEYCIFKCEKIYALRKDISIQSFNDTNFY